VLRGIPVVLDGRLYFGVRAGESRDT
jgi:hypothetical protein